jgi:hypothetical protein
MDSAGTIEVPNPVCLTDDLLPPPPFADEVEDPAEPHPDEPGAPSDAPARRPLGGDLVGGRATL